MKNQIQFKTTRSLVTSFAVIALISVSAQAQKVTVEGLIVGRNGPTMSVKTDTSPRVTVVLSETTKATEKGGFLGMGRKDPGITALVPGLPVKVEGTYDADHKLVAQKVTFTSSSLRMAKQIDAGLNPVAEQVAAAQDAIKTDEKNIELAQQDIETNKKDILTNTGGIAANTQALGVHGEVLAANKQAIGQTNQRIAKLDEFEKKGDYTVSFANGKAIVSAKDKAELADFVKSVADTPGYMIQVQGYASTTGSPVLNQKLSAERAEAVLSIIQQSGSVPLTRILAPAAMGTSDQVGNNHTRNGQAQNRRVVVTILINKGINS